MDENGIECIEEKSGIAKKLLQQTEANEKEKPGQKIEVACL